MASDHGGLRETLVAAALAMLESDAGEPSLRAVARAAGVSAMAPYRHFADKSALLAAVADRGFTVLRERLLAADGVADPRAALLGQGLAYIAFARAHPALFRLMFATQPGPAKPVDDTATAYDVLARRVGELVPAQPETAALACWSIVHGLATLLLDGRLPGLGPEQERRTLGLFVSALGRTAGNDA
jgi:AcrR family transcriptional regulator